MMPSKTNKTTRITAKGRRLAPAAAEVVILPRDPEVGCVYWQWPQGGERGEVILLVEDDEHWREIDRFEVGSSGGERFFRFAAPDRRHLARLIAGDDEAESTAIVSPRRESGEEEPSFVRVEVGEQGLKLEPTEHDHPVHGLFPASSRSTPSSKSFYK